MSKYNAVITCENWEEGEEENIQGTQEEILLMIIKLFGKDDIIKNIVFSVKD